MLRSAGVDHTLVNKPRILLTNGVTLEFGKQL